MIKRAREKSLDLKKDRLSIFWDGAWAFGGPFVFLVFASALGYGALQVPLGVANIATLLFTSLTVGGLLGDKWTADIDARAVRQIELIHSHAASRTQPRATFWGTLPWSKQNDASALRPSEVSEIVAIASLRANNSSVRSKMQTATYFLFMFAVISGGFSIAGELRLLLP